MSYVCLSAVPQDVVRDLWAARFVRDHVTQCNWTYHIKACFIVSSYGLLKEWRLYTVVKNVLLSRVICGREMRSALETYT
jgi:hypothetical protein